MGTGRRDREGSRLTVDGGEEAEGSHRAEDRATGQRNRESQEAHRTSQDLTVPEWGCLRCHTNHTHGSVNTRDKSKIHHSSCTVALSAHCRVISCGSVPRARPSQEPHVITQSWSIPVVPATAAPVWVPGQVGSKQKAGVSGLAPGTLARVGQAVLAG